MEQKDNSNGGVFERAEYAKKEFWNERFEKSNDYLLLFIIYDYSLGINPHLTGIWNIKNCKDIFLKFIPLIKPIEF